jgi:hypothetical protein
MTTELAEFLKVAVILYVCTAIAFLWGAKFGRDLRSGDRTR